MEKELIQKIDDILQYVKEQEYIFRSDLKRVHPTHRESARNLIHYLALRAFDLRKIQERLSHLSISSLGHSEGYTLTNLRKILQLLRMIAGKPVGNTDEVFHSPLNYFRSKQQLKSNTDALFGIHPEGGISRIMVTMPTEAADDYQLIEDLIRAGMNIARINTSHDDPDVWSGMIDNIRRAEVKTGLKCLVYMDLAGPKIRTGALSPAHSETDKKGRPCLILKKGDLLKVKAQVEESGADTLPAIAITLPQVLDDIKQGDQIAFDDGKISGLVKEVHPGEILVEIGRAKHKGSKLRSDKGVNFPETKLKLPSLTEQDLANIPFVAAHADILGYSFVRRPGDVEKLQTTLAEVGRMDIGIILKIETKEAFNNLPALLLAAMRSPRAGVMIARGDLAAEISFERVSEVQEEILWICEAAHIPGIWATQVLEKLAKKGVASRAEITDAAMAARAECVMLNKGPYILDAVTTLSDIIKRMEKHHFKQKNNLRPLRVASRFLEDRGLPLPSLPA
ncbi:MAG: pyruvate kinase [Saprospiraceae bacterium]|nr:pyruvate kinase [Saprospiraceae bacterium]